MNAYRSSVVFIVSMISWIYSYAYTEEELLLLKRVNFFMTQTKSFTANFTFTLGDKEEQGRFYYAKPSRFRFEYNNKNELLISDGRWVSYEDKSINLNQEFPLGDTFLSKIFSGTIDFTNHKSVADISTIGSGMFKVTFIVDDLPGLNYLELYFNTNPVFLLQWVLYASDGTPSITALEGIELNKPLNLNLFERTSGIKR